MTFPTRTKPTRRQIANHLEGLSALHLGTTPNFTPQRAPVKRGPQKETAVNKVNQQWARLKGGELRRNRIGFAEIRPGVKIPFGLGTGTLDLVGPMPVRITASMVGKTIQAYCEIDSKTDEGVIAPHQQERVDYLRDKGALSGIARGAEDMEALYLRFLAALEGR